MIAATVLFAVLIYIVHERLDLDRFNRQARASDAGGCSPEAHQPRIAPAIPASNERGDTK